MQRIFFPAAVVAGLLVSLMMSIPAFAIDQSQQHSDNYEVVANDTLMEIAGKTRPDGVSVNQMMLALFRANPEAFFQSNINNLRIGAVLRMPTQEELEAIDAKTADEEVSQQYALWREYRAQGITLAAMPQEPVVATQEASEPKAQAETAVAPCDPVPDITDVDLATLHSQLKAVFPGLSEDSVSRTPVGGLVQVIYGPNVLYMSPDGRYALQGSMIDLKTNANLTEEVKVGMRANVLKAIPESEMVVFGPEKPKHSVTVFTDIDCGYCRKLHSEINSYKDKGIEVRYLFYPRAGIGSPAYQKAVNVWCADDRKDAMTKAKSGLSLPNKTCKNPVASNYEAGQMMGVSGTPAMVTEDGYMLPGYVPADRLAGILDELKAQ